MNTRGETLRPLVHVVGVVVVVTAVGWMAIEVIRRSTEPVYPIGTRELAIALIGSAMVLVGLAVAYRTSSYDQVFVAGLATVFLVVGVAALLSIGFVLILTGLVLVALLVRSRETLVGRAVVSGVAIGLGLALTAWVFIQSPYVRCLEDGVEVSVPGDLTAGGSGSDAIFSGRARFDGRILTYTCQDGELVAFEMLDR